MTALVLPPADNWVHCSQYWMTDSAGAVIGFVSVRHDLNSFLSERGGHIG